MYRKVKTPPQASWLYNSPNRTKEKHRRQTARKERARDSHSQSTNSLINKNEHFTTLYPPGDISATFNFRRYFSELILLAKHTQRVNIFSMFKHTHRHTHTRARTYRQAGRQARVRAAALATARAQAVRVSRAGCLDRSRANNTKTSRQNINTESHFNCFIKALTIKHKTRFLKKKLPYKTYLTQTHAWINRTQNKQHIIEREKKE